MLDAVALAVMEQIPQRRKSTRFAMSQPLEVSVETPEGRPLSGRVRNVSQGGVGLEIQPGRAFQPGEELILQLMADPSQRFFATARVIWTRPPEEGGQALGLEWTNSGPSRQRVEALVASAAAGAGARTRSA